MNFQIDNSKLESIITSTICFNYTLTTEEFMVPTEKMAEFCKKFHTQNKVLKRYVRNKKKFPVGVLVAFKRPTDSQVVIGWSKCHMNMDNFDKHMGTYVAINRGLKHSIDSIDVTSDEIVPQVVRKSLSDFRVRVKKYFKLS